MDNHTGGACLLPRVYTGTDNNLFPKRAGTSSMDLSYYQLESSRTAIYPEHGNGTDTAITYVLLGLLGESGELANKWKKYLRDGTEFDSKRDELIAELGDVLWYIAQLHTELAADLSNTARANLAKLLDRQSRNTLGGSGDNR